MTWRWGPLNIVNEGKYLVEFRIHAEVDSRTEPQRIYFVDPEMVVGPPGIPGA